MNHEAIVAGNGRLLLATDLDGTFAGGTPEARTRLQRVLSEHPDSVLVYVTGRTVPATRELMGEVGLPLPDVLIADVGTTVVRGADFSPVPELESMLDEAWVGKPRVREAMDGAAGLEEQAIDPPRRVSYWIREGSPDEAIERAAQRLGELNVDLVASAGVYLDVLPGGVNKGSTLRRTLEWLGREEDDVVVAGDTLNDLALFETGIRGVIVGNCEPALIERVGDLASVYCAREHGAAGILEGLRHFGHVRDDAG